MYDTIVLSSAVRRAYELRQKEQEHLADMITSKIVKAWNEGRQ